MSEAGLREVVGVANNIEPLTARIDQQPRTVTG